MTSSAWPLARRGRCGPCIALMTKKVEEGRRRHAGFMQWRASSAPRRALSFLLALTQAIGSRYEYSRRPSYWAFVPVLHGREAW